jgi:hypothetical protein
MLARALLRHIMDDEALTRHLGDPEARILVEWLVDQAEQLARALPPEEAASEVRALCRRGRALACFVRLWCLDSSPGAAGQLAAAERFPWPLPAGAVDPCDLMQAIVTWESASLSTPASPPGRPLAPRSGRPTRPQTG